MNDTFVLIYDGHKLNSTCLGLLDVSQWSIQETQLGGLGTGNFTVKSSWESDQTKNILAPNMVTVHRRIGELSAAVVADDTSFTVVTTAGFAVGQSLGFYNPVTAHYDVDLIVTDITGTTITLSSAIPYAYDIGSEVYVLFYRGMVSPRTRDISLDPTIKFSTVGYYSQLGCFIEAQVTGGGMETGWFLYTMLENNSSKVDVILDTSNFVMTSNGSYTSGASGTATVYNSTGTNEATSSLIQDLVSMANTNADGYTYTLQVDEHATAHFFPLMTPSSVGTDNDTFFGEIATALGSLFTNEGDAYSNGGRQISIDLVDYGSNAGAGNENGLYDSIGGFTIQDQDTSSLVNTYIVTGGTPTDPDSTATTVNIEETNPTSISTYGQMEGTLSNPYINDADDLANWTKWQLENAAFPKSQYNLTLTCSGSFITTRDYVTITGFTDDSTESFTPFTVTTSWDAASVGQFSQTIVGGDLHPNVSQIMKQISQQHYTATQFALDKTSNLKDRFIQSGFTMVSNGSGVNMAEGTLSAIVGNTLTEFYYPATTYVPPIDGTYSAGFYYRNTDGSQCTLPKVIYYPGMTATNYTALTLTDYQVIPLWSFNAVGGVVLNPLNDRRNIAGVTTNHIIPGAVGQAQLAGDPNLGTAPALATGTNLTGPEYLSAGSGAYEVALTFTLNVLNPLYMAGIRMLSVSTGDDITSDNVTIHGDYPASQTGIYKVLLSGFPAGAQKDIYVARLDTQSNTSAALFLCTTDANPITVDTSSLPAMPSGTSLTTTTTATISYPVVGNGTYDAVAAFALDSNGSSAANWLAFLEAVAKPVNSSNWTVYNDVEPSSDGSYTVAYGGLGSGQKYNLGIRGVDYQNNRTSITALGSTVTNPILNIADGAVSYTNLGSSVLDVDGTIRYDISPSVMQGVISEDGALNLNPVGGTVGTLPYDNMDISFTSAILDTANADGSYIASSSVTTRNVQPTSVLGTQLYADHYTTSLKNVPINAYTWSSAAYDNLVISDGAAYYYKCAESAFGDEKYDTVSSTTITGPGDDGVSSSTTNVMPDQERVGKVDNTAFFVIPVISSGTTKFTVEYAVCCGTTGTAMAVSLTDATIFGDSICEVDPSGPAQVFDEPTTFSPVVNRWYHVVALCDTVTPQISLYIDGTFIQTSTDLHTALDSTSAQHSYLQFNNTDDFDGYVRNVAYYGSLLNAAQIAAHAKTFKTFAYNTGTTTDVSSTLPSTDTVAIGADDKYSFLFQHGTFTTGSAGIADIHFTGTSVSDAPNVLDSTTFNNSSTSTVTHTTTSSTSNAEKTAAVSVSSTATITQEENTTYSNVSHSGSATTATGSTASISYSIFNSTSSYSVPSIGMGPYSPSGYLDHDTGEQVDTSTWGQMDNSYITPAWLGSSSGTYGNGPSSITYSELPSTLPVGTNTPDNQDATVDTPIEWYFAVYYVLGGERSEYAVYGPVTGSGTITCTTYFAGYYAVAMFPQWVTNPGTAPGNNNNNCPTVSDTQSVTWQSGSDTTAAGSWISIASTGTAIAPVSTGTELKLDITSITAPSDSNGASQINVRCKNPSGTVVYTSNGVSTGNYYYYDASAAAGTYSWEYQTAVATDNHTGSSTYAGQVTGTLSWYQSDASTSYSYTVANGTASNYLTGSATIAPTTTGTAISLVLSSITVPSDSYGSSDILLKLYDPSSNLVGTYNASSTGTYSYHSATAPAGQYKWVICGEVATDNENGSSSYATSCAGSSVWYESVTTTSTTWNNNAGVSWTYQTPSTTLAPSGASAAVELRLTSVISPSNSYGTSEIVVYLKNPSGAYISSASDFQYSTNGGSTWHNTASDGTALTYATTAATIYRYYNASASAGTYTWVVFSRPVSNSTGDTSFACSWAGNHSWYQVGAAGGNTYVLAADGYSQRTATTDGNILFTQALPSQMQFDVYNNASESLNSTIGILVAGV